MKESSEIQDFYARRTLKHLLIVVGLFLLVIIAASLAIPLGSASVSLEGVVQVILSKIPFLDTEADVFDIAIIWDIRLPRILLAVVGGFGFAISGAAMQGVLRNPLASPFTLGISSAACFGGALAMLFGAEMAGSGKFAVIASAFVFGLGALLLIYALSRRRGASPETVILCGIALMYMFMAMTSALSMGGMLGFLLWGSLVQSSWDGVLVVSVLILIVLPPLLIQSWDMNALALGDDVAQGVGVNLRRVRIITVICATLVVSAIVSFTGLIGFVCLVAPFLARRIVGNDYRFIFPCAGLFGSLILLGSDTLARNMVESVDIPVAFMTIIVGVPFLIYIALFRGELT